MYDYSYVHIYLYTSIFINVSKRIIWKLSSLNTNAIVKNNFLEYIWGKEPPWGHSISSESKYRDADYLLEASSLFRGEFPLHNKQIIT